MTKVLYVHGGLLGRGGTEAVMLNYFRNFDKSRITVDFMVHGFETGVHDEEILAAGSKIYHVVPKGVNFRENELQIRKVFQENHYDVVHAHMDCGNAQILKIAKQCGVPIRISHSHNTGVQTHNFLKKIYNSLEKHKIPRYATHLFACSDLAGKWLYGKNYTVIPNAIDVQKFRFSPAVRSQILNELHIREDDLVFGHIGRFCYQKNHTRLLTIFSELLQNCPSAKLLLLGEGELFQAIQDECHNLGIDNHVIFAGAVSNTADYMQAMDCFILPSHYEGLPVVMVEAQAAGLPILASDVITAKSKLTPLVHFLSLQEPDAQWAEMLLQLASEGRQNTAEMLTRQGFDIAQNAKKMQSFYEKGGNFQ